MILASTICFAGFGAGSSILIGTSTFATDAGNLDGHDSTYYLPASSAPATYIRIQGLTTISGTATFINVANATVTYSQNSNLLDGRDSTYFLAGTSATLVYQNKIGPFVLPLVSTTSTPITLYSIGRAQNKSGYWTIYMATAVIDSKGWAIIGTQTDN
jgi:hypothetical protein